MQGITHIVDDNGTFRDTANENDRIAKNPVKTGRCRAYKRQTH